MRPSAAAGVARPCNIGSYRDDSLVKPHDRPDVPDEDEYLTLPNEVPEEMLEQACHDGPASARL